MNPHRDQSARDALDDLGLVCDDHTEDLRRKSEAAPAHSGAASGNASQPDRKAETIMPRNECTRCTVPAGAEKDSLDEAANLVEAARLDLEATVRNLDDGAPLLTVADLYAAAAHLRKAGELIDQAAETLEARR